jgi:hypothetical protein
VEKKALLTVAFVSVLLLLTVAATQFVNLGQANPYIRDWKKEGEVPPPDGTNPPVVSIFSPANNTAYSSNNFLLNFSVTIERSNNISLGLSELYYTASWQKDRTEVDLRSFYVENNYTYPSTFSINMAEVPEGPRWLEVYAVATGFAYETRREVKGIFYTTYYVGYKITGSSMVNFTVDTTPPIISTLSVENKTYSTSNVTLNVIVNEPVSQIIYSLDGQRNVTVAGNTTLADLPKGDHTVTVYATDEAGNIGASETMYFSVEVPEPFPAAPAAASAASVAVIGVGLLIYFRKRNGGRDR